MAAFSDVGDHCAIQLCKQHDFLPFKCDLCAQTYCGEHRTYAAHECANFSHTTRDVQLLPCPACQKPLPLTQAQVTDPDSVVNHHLLTECPKTGHRRDRCPVRSCKEKMLPASCHACGVKTCLKHRFADHDCPAKSGATRTNGNRTATRTNTRSNNRTNREPNNVLRETAERRRQQAQLSSSSRHNSSSGSSAAPQCGNTCRIH
mmetsp:Transcript_34304/g.86091  ORF Transcript_34304/g.86091 Transcript_34304/m.86091 type:complete len:204 (-) Transcript_34304:47-658(-)